MPLTQTPVDAVALVIDYLLDRTAITDLVDDRVFGYAILPADPTFPLIACHRFGGTFGPGFDGHLDRPILWFDVWAAKDAPDSDAQAIVAALRQALITSEIAGAYTRGVVGKTEEVTGPQWLPDTAEGRVRFTLTVQLWTHP